MLGLGFGGRLVVWVVGVCCLIDLSVELGVLFGCLGYALSLLDNGLFWLVFAFLFCCFVWDSFCVWLLDLGLVGCLRFVIVDAVHFSLLDFYTL